MEPRSPSRLNPVPAWTAVTEAPLAGLCLAREAGRLLVWDTAHQLTILDLNGERLFSETAPGAIFFAAISDNGERIALIVGGPRLVLLDHGLVPVADRVAPSEPTGLAIDPHGWYVAISSRSLETQFYTRHGKPAGSFETMHPLAHMRFVPNQPSLVAAAALGSLYWIDLEEGPSSGSLACEERWRTQVMSNIGRLAITGDGGVILASCYTHGVQRFDARGRNEGAYHLGGTVAFAVPDFIARTIAVATTEGELAILNAAGHVRWRSGLPRGPIAVETDAIGRYLVYGLSTGEVVRLDLEHSAKADEEEEEGTAPAVPKVHSVGGTLTQGPAWTVPVAQSDEQAETALVAVLDDPPLAAAITSRNRLQVYTPDGEAWDQAPVLAGVGRAIRVGPGWIAVATDRNVVLFDAVRREAMRLDVSLAELTHLVIQPDSYGVATVQERDRIGRVTVAGRWVWRKELNVPVEEIALGPENRTAVSTEDGRLLIFDAAGSAAGTYRSVPAEPLLLAHAPKGSPAEVAWLTLARNAQFVRGHRADGHAVWESSLPWQGWQMHALDRAVIVEAIDGRALAFDGSGHTGPPSRPETDHHVYFRGPESKPGRLVRSGEHLICSNLRGRVLWRAIVHAPIGPIAAGPAGAAALIGRELAWFPHPVGMRPDSTP